MAALKLSSEDPHLSLSLISCKRSMRPDSLRELEDPRQKKRSDTRGRFYSVSVRPSLDYAQRSDRGASLSGRGQWACAWRRPANLGGGAHSKEETQAYSQAP